MSVNGLNTSLTALRANQLRVDVGANNVANVNTDGFQASTVQTEDRADVLDIGTGTRVASTYAPPRPGMAAPSAPTGQTNPQVNQVDGTGIVEDGDDAVEASNTDLVVEMTNMMNSRNAYNVNTAMARTQQEVSQTLMDLRG